MCLITKLASFSVFVALDRKEEADYAQNEKQSLPEDKIYFLPLEQMLTLIVATSIVIGGCIWNGYELEKVISHTAGGKQLGLHLTFYQVIFISVLAGTHCLVLRLFELLSSQRQNSPTRLASALCRSISNNNNGNENRLSAGAAATITATSAQSANDAWARRPMFTLSFRQAIWVALLFWTTNSLNNAVFRFGIAVPIQQLVRSSSLLSSTVVGYFAEGKRYSKWQIFHLMVITIGIAVLSIVGASPSAASKEPPMTSSSTAHAAPSSTAKNLGGAQCLGDCSGGGAAATVVVAAPAANSSSSVTSYTLFPDTNDADAVFFWLCGIVLLLCSAFMATFLGMAQTHMYKIAEQAKKGSSSLPGVTEEAIFTSHFISVGFFGVYYFLRHFLSSAASDALNRDDDISNSNNPFAVFLTSLPADLQRHILGNCVSQYVCIWGVFALARTAGSFFLTMVTTVRKFVSLVLSMILFSHASEMSWPQSAAIVAVTISVTVYPFLTSPASAVVLAKSKQS